MRLPTRVSTVGVRVRVRVRISTDRQQTPHWICGSAQNATTQKRVPHLARDLPQVTEEHYFWSFGNVRDGTHCSRSCEMSAASDEALPSGGIAGSLSAVVAASSKLPNQRKPHAQSGRLIFALWRTPHFQIEGRGRTHIGSVRSRLHMPRFASTSKSCEGNPSRQPSKAIHPVSHQGPSIKPIIEAIGAINYISLEPYTSQQSTIDRIESNQSIRSAIKKEPSILLPIDRMEATTARTEKIWSAIYN